MKPPSAFSVSERLSLHSRHVHLCYFFLNPEDIKSLIWGLFGTLAKEQGSLELTSDYGAQRTR
jgi:hypothetical protein